MLGIIYMLYGGTVRIARSVKKSIADYIAMEKTWNDEPGIYKDSLSKRYSTKTNNQMFFTIDEKGHRVYKSVKGTECIDLTQAEMDRDYENAKQNRKNGQTVCELKEDYAHQKQDRDALRGCVGTRYKDLDNGKIYVLRSWNNIKSAYKKKVNLELYKILYETTPSSTFYMDVTNGKLVRVKDGTYEIEKNRMMEYNYSQERIQNEIKKKKAIDNAWIEKHNREQEKIIKTEGVSSLEFYHNSCIGY